MTYQTYLDHYQTEQLGLYLRHYPRIGLNAGLLFNLLLYERLGLDPEHLYPDEIRRHPWSNALDRLLALDALVLDPAEGLSSELVGQTLDAVMSPHMAGLSLPDFQDVLNYTRCVRAGLSFCISRRRSQDIGHIVEIAHKTFGVPPPREDTALEIPNRNAVAEWLFDIECPALVVRNEKMRRDLFAQGPHMVAENGRGEQDSAFTSLLLAAKWYDLQQSWFISPDELVDVLNNRSVMTVLRAKVHSLAQRAATRAELNDAVKSEHEELNERVGISDWTFTGLNLALCWAPYSGAVTSPAQVAVNWRLKQPYGWLLFMSTLNRRFREGPLGQYAGENAGGLTRQ